MEAVLAKAGAGPLARKLVLLLAQKRRLFALADVIRAFEAPARPAEGRDRRRSHLSTRRSRRPRPTN